ncbi:MAG: fructosamine kinase family protein [Waddliaceae bacterium]
MESLLHIIHETLRERFNCKNIHCLTSASGGVLNQCLSFATDKGKFFVKANKENPVAMFAAEAAGLRSIIKTGTLKVPTPYFYGQKQGCSFLILEHLELLPHTAESQRQLGKQLAEMHLKKEATQFGYPIDNTIGTTPQINGWKENWVEFFITNRLDYQLRLAETRYHDKEIRKSGEKFLKKFSDFFTDLTIFPSLLHGDLWNGNTAANGEGNPVVYDPAVYYGHHEADLGILLMFGGFTSDFHQAYHENIPKQPGFEERQLGYQLYHYLNHYNLFGDSYRPTCLSIIKKV